ncbi:MAG: acyl-CoA dehydrogenase family protein [Cyanobacteria bacterium SZAS LIN-3]|nr:acyl-CoA dehydrogenase family protein [Cyanobacteria bacterium SZAS LIN-3]
MLFETTQRVKDKLALLQIFMQEHIYPNEERFARELAAAAGTFTVPEVLDKLKRRAHEQGLWNLFLTNSMKGPGLTNLEYAPLCEMIGRSPMAAEVFNCSAPDSGNMELLDKFGNKEQKERWLKPLMAADFRSCFAMTEPAVASSDATSIACSMQKVGDNYVINGRKWWVNGAMDPRCKLAIVMCRSNPQAEKHKQHSMILVPMETPGVTVVRPLRVFGYDDAPRGFAEVDFLNVMVPATNLLQSEGKGFEIAQGRLGPSRFHSCMRAIGIAERALEAMIHRAEYRTAFGEKLIDAGQIREHIARSRIEIEQARYLGLRAARKMDLEGNKEARLEIAMAKATVPTMALAVLDRAIQVHGAAGLSDDFVLARAYSQMRAMKIADGPDEVHLETIAQAEIKKQHQAQRKHKPD